MKQETIFNPKTFIIWFLIFDFWYLDLDFSGHHLTTSSYEKNRIRGKINWFFNIIEISAKLKRTKPAIILENQLLRAGTSCSLNYGEAVGAESDKDFIHKIQIVLKELRETYIALRIIKKGNLSKDYVQLGKGINENNQLIGIFVKSIKTLKGL